jgi:hypothetical protein
MKRWQGLVAVLPLVGGLLAAPAAVAATTTPPGPKVDMKVLLLSSGGDLQLAAWKTTLDTIGVPYDTFIRSDANPVTTSALQVDDSHGKYNAIIVTDGRLMTKWSGVASDTEQATVASYEQRFKVREIAEDTVSSAFGLEWPTVEGSPTALGVAATLTAAGQQVFPYLNPTLSVPYESGLYMYLTPVHGNLSEWNSWGVTDVTSYDTLVQGPSVTSGGTTGPAGIVGIAHHSDGRDEMVTTVNSSDWTTSDKLLHIGMLNWVTKGLYLGYWRNYFTMHFDDVLLADTRWSTTAHCSPGTAGCTATTTDIRMTPADVTRAVAWSQQNNVRLDLVFNSQGATAKSVGNGNAKGQQDALTTALLANKATFGWISHTWSHEDFDTADLSTMTTQIKKNIDWATANKLPANPAELVTGGHTGLTNPLFPTALSKTGVKAIASDASYPQWASVQPIGPATVVPRHPTELAYNVGTNAEQLDQFYTTYGNDPWVNGQGPQTWDTYLKIASNMILQSVVLNDPRPYYAHQNNLAEDGTFYAVANTMLAKYRGWFSVPLAQPTMTEAGKLLNQASAWRAALSAGAVTAYVRDGIVHIISTRSVDIPVTGTTVGAAYGGSTSGWVTLAPNREVVLTTK